MIRNSPFFPFVGAGSQCLSYSLGPSSVRKSKRLDKVESSRTSASKTRWLWHASRSHSLTCLKMSSSPSLPSPSRIFFHQITTPFTTDNIMTLSPQLRFRGTLSSCPTNLSMRWLSPSISSLSISTCDPARIHPNKNKSKWMCPSAMHLAYRMKTGRSRRPPSANAGLACAPGQGIPKITNNRPGMLSSMASGGEPSGASRLVGGRNSRQKTEYEASPLRCGGGSRKPVEENVGLDSCQVAPQRPKWWIFGRRKRSVNSSAVENSASSSTWNSSSSFNRISRRENALPGKAPLNRLHSLEKTNWISLLGGGAPPQQARTHDSEETGGSSPSSSSSFFSEKKASTASPLEQDLNVSRSTGRFLQAAKALHGKKKGERLAFTALLSDEQKLAIVNKEIESKWWARFWYRPFRHVTDHRIRTTKRILHVFLFLFSVVFFSASVYLYREEMKILKSLTPEDRADYIFLITNMRFSDVWHMAMEVLNKEDPLEALPAPARYHIALEEARRRGWTSYVDWEVEQRVLHPNSALEEGDYLHVFYWVMMYIGSVASGGNSFFSTRLLGDTLDATVAAQQESVQAEQKVIGPFAPPPQHF